MPPAVPSVEAIERAHPAAQHDAVAGGQHGDPSCGLAVSDDEQRAPLVERGGPALGTHVRALDSQQQMRCPPGAVGVVGDRPRHDRVGACRRRIDEMTGREPVERPLLDGACRRDDGDDQHDAAGEWRPHEHEEHRRAARGRDGPERRTRTERVAEEDAGDRRERHDADRSTEHVRR